jgi:ornithine cyclodeaminase/alanine dehydrogenase-like protein (mu-crystallin family)
MLILSEADVRQLLPMEELIPAMADALAAFSSGAVQQPLRTVIEVGASKAFFGVMPAFIPDSGALGTKLVTVFGNNLAVGLPSHLATIVLLDSATGELRGLLDGRYITEARTAAVSAVSTRLLARPDASALAIIGSGVQAWSHLEALRLVRTLSEVRVWSPTAAHRERFAQEAEQKLSMLVRPAASAEEALDGADLVALVSSSREPVARSAWIEDGAHVCAVGACRPDQREMDSDLVARSHLFVDSRTGALAEAGDVVLPIAEGRFTAAHIAGELGEVVSGRVPGRASASEVTIFKSLGMAVEDVAAAHLAFEKAAARGVGRGVVL